jgi:hypothetical protein
MYTGVVLYRCRQTLEIDSGSVGETVFVEFRVFNFGTTTGATE